LVNCGWTRLTYLLFALTILIALAQVRDPSADPRPLATKTPSGATVEENALVTEEGLSEPAQTVPREGTTHTASVEYGGGDHRSPAIVDGAQDIVTPGSRVFYRPAPASPASGGKPASDPACADLGVFPSDRRITFPLPRKYLGSYEDTWGAPRPQGGHEGTDLMAPTGTAAYAVTDGTIVAVAGANENGWNTLGGYAVMLRAAYSVGPVKQGDLFYYAHLNHESALEIGTRVSVGQTVGYVGDTGQGPEVTRGLFPPHLHLGWYGAGSAVTSGAMNPYPLLEWIRANGGAITGGSGARYCEAPRTGGPVPSDGESRWLALGSPGMNPDLGTGANQPAPGPGTAGPEREIGHTGGAAPAQQKEPAPDQSPPDTPGGTRPKTDPESTGSSGLPNPSRAEPPPAPSVPGDESPEVPSGESAQDHSDAPTSGADPEGDEANDPPGEEQNPDEDTHGENGGDGTDAPEDPEEEPEEDSQPPGDQTSPGEDQYAPETDGESDPETTTAAR
jgi:murein DD-endopeptidase MepM/ murein hydrolase activator NlpD